MGLISILLQSLIIFFVPYLAKKISKNTASWLSPVVICYLIGILFGNLHLFDLNESITTYFTQGTILLAIPLLLFGTDLSDWLLDFREMTFAFILCVFCGIIAVLITVLINSTNLSNTWQIAGMIAAIFSGGIPNMQAVGMALEVDSNTIVLLNAADIFIGGLFLVFLTSIAHSFLGLFLNNFERKNNWSTVNKKESEINVYDIFKGIGTALVLIILSVGLSYLIFNALNSTFIILSLTTLSILISRIKIINNWKGTFETGDYLLLMFCVAIGMSADFSTILKDSVEVVVFLGIAWTITVLLHWLLCFIFKIDRDSTLIASTAAIYGPVFIGQIANTIGNRKLIFPGIALGLLGLAMGNYVGVFVAWIAKAL